ncbi:hypothetical protein L3X07_01775 [Levilactobacillus brevis]|nr:hypothetical protein [Levilactobacillus brevis]
MKMNQHSWLQRVLISVSVAVVTLPIAIQGAQAKTTDNLMPHEAPMATLSITIVKTLPGTLRLRIIRSLAK